MRKILLPSLLALGSLAALGACVERHWDAQNAAGCFENAADGEWLRLDDSSLAVLASPALGEEPVLLDRATDVYGALQFYRHGTDEVVLRFCIAEEDDRSDESRLGFFDRLRCERPDEREAVFSTAPPQVCWGSGVVVGSGGGGGASPTGPSGAGGAGGAECGAAGEACAEDGDCCAGECLLGLCAL